jgi:hypothetical protein
MSIDLSRVRFGSAFGPISPYPTVLLRANRGTDNRSQRSEMYTLDWIMPTL